MRPCLAMHCFLLTASAYNVLPESVTAMLVRTLVNAMPSTFLTVSMRACAAAEQYSHSAQSRHDHDESHKRKPSLPVETDAAQ